MRHLCDDRISLHLILLLSLAPTQLRAKGTGEATAICVDQELPGLPLDLKKIKKIKLLRDGLRVLWMYGVLARSVPQFCCFTSSARMLPSLLALAVDM